MVLTAWLIIDIELFYFDVTYFDHKEGKVHGLKLCISKFIVHASHLGVRLKCRFCTFRRSGVAGDSTSNTVLHEVHAAHLLTSYLVVRNYRSYALQIQVFLSYIIDAFKSTHMCKLISSTDLDTSLLMHIKLGGNL